jgi:hypothetical protein
MNINRHPLGIVVALLAISFATNSYAAKNDDSNIKNGVAHKVAALAAQTQSLQDQINSLELGSGTQGPQGEQGIQGEAGPQGEQGVQGDAGPQGEQGVQGETGLQGDTGSRGEQGEQGVQGDTGPQGEQGVQGDTGPQGEQGIQGDTGPQGEQGVQGDTGPQGEQGVQGDTGPQGEQGIQGDTGPQGEQGIQGDTGPQGEQGVQGDTGPQGEQGVQGDTGPQGEQGVQGDTGPQGEQGIQGETGPQGEQGIQGEAGPQGEQGIQGETGLQGEQGVQGETGPRGQQGDTGPQGPAGETPDLAAIQAQIDTILAILEQVTDIVAMDGPRVTCADFLQTEIWARNVYGFDLKGYTNSTLHFLGAYPDTAICEEDEGSFSVSAPGSKIIVATDPGNLAGDVNNDESFFCARGDNPGLVNSIVANAPVVNALCRGMGYQSGIITGTIQNSCPYAYNLDADGKSWDIGNTDGIYHDAVEGFTCFK